MDTLAISTIIGSDNYITGKEIFTPTLSLYKTTLGWQLLNFSVNFRRLLFLLLENGKYNRVRMRSRPES